MLLSQRYVVVDSEGQEFLMLAGAFSWIEIRFLDRGIILTKRSYLGLTRETLVVAQAASVFRNGAEVALPKRETGVERSQLNEPVSAARLQASRVT